MRKNLFVTIAAAALVLAGCASEKPKKAEERVPVTVATAEAKSVPLDIQAIGSVQPMSSVAVKSLVGGQLLSVSFREGQDVRKGQLLFTIDPRPLQAALAQAQANLARDEAQLRNAQSEQARYAQLVKQDFVTREEADKILANLEAMRATVDADRAMVDNARLQLSYCEIRSPLDGRTGNLMVHAGNVVKANDVPLVTILQVSPIYVQFTVPDAALAEVRQHANPSEIAVSALGQAGAAPIAEGRLSFIDNTIDPATGTITMKAVFDNAARALWPGQFVPVRIQTGVRSNATVVPATAVQTSQKGTYVYVVRSDSGVEMRPVQVFRNVGTDAVIDRGVSAGETVVTDGQLRLTPKSKVEVKRG